MITWRVYIGLSGVRCFVYFRVGRTLLTLRVI
jgi:hypothetical protein